MAKSFIQVLEENYDKIYKLTFFVFLNSENSFKVYIEQFKGFEERKNEYISKYYMK